MSRGATANAVMVSESNEKTLTNFVRLIRREKADEKMEPKRIQSQQEYKMTIVWRNVGTFVILHTLGLWGFYYYLTTAKIQTIAFMWTVGTIGGVGITGGAHRLWAHRTYKAKLPMRILLMLMQCTAHQNTIFEWVRDHRVHHKFTDTNADPHNSKRGFFFSHIGWLTVKKHPDIQERGKGIDMSDVANDPVVAFQKKYFWILMPLLCFIIPTYMKIYFFNETFKVAFLLTMTRYTISLHHTWLVNSAAHMWGYRPYDATISPTENWFVALVAYGEGWHNYHHAFPWDYKAAELGNYWLNFTTLFIDFFAVLGLAYDLKSPSIDMVRKRSKKTGDGSRETISARRNSHEGDVWGWDDPDMRPEDKQEVTISAKSH